MRYLIIDSPDPGEQNRYLVSKASPRFGKRITRAGRTYEVTEIELYQAGSDDDPLQVRAEVRRIG